MKLYETKKSAEIFKRAEKSIIGGLSSDVQKGAFQEYPLYMSHGKGSKFYDVDGNEYIDYLVALGPLIHGYGSEPIINAVKKQLDLGTIFGSPTESLVELADLLVEVIPCAEKVSNFSTGGSDANTQAIRLSRAYTGKTKLLKFEGHYHGWLDELKVTVEAPSVDVLGPRTDPWKIRHAYGQVDPINVMLTPYNDLDLVEKKFKKYGNEIACVIVETIMCNNEPVLPQEGFLEGLRELCTKYDVVMIFDEIITGFRVALGGAQEYFGVTPDLATFGKAIAGGFPISTCVGREDIINAGSLQAGTFNGNPISVAAALACIKELKKPNVYKNLNAISEKLSKGVVEIGAKYGLEMHSFFAGGIWTIRFGSTEPIIDYRDHYAKSDKKMYAKVAEECLKRGIRINPWRGRQYLSTAHTDEDVKFTLDVFDEIFSQI